MSQSDTSASADAAPSVQPVTAPAPAVPAAPVALASVRDVRRETSSDDDDDDDFSFDGRRRRAAAPRDPSDPFNLHARFVRTHRQDFARGLSEIRAGAKCSCWSWFLLPVAPWMRNGIEGGSWTNRQYALRDAPPNSHLGFDAARAYLRFPERDGVNLRRNYIEMVSAIGDALERGISFVRLLGVLDDPKARSSFRLFERVSRDGFDPEVHAAVTRTMRLAKEEPDS
jgi:uncharacterized protein (DUF1810 family)